MKLISDSIEITDELRGKFDKVLESVAPMIRKKAYALSKQIGEQLEDVEQMYRMTLLSAMCRYDENKGVKFSTYFYQALNQVAPMIFAHYTALKRIPHIVDSETGKYVKMREWVTDNTENESTSVNPEGTLLRLEQMEVDRSFRLNLLDGLSRPIDRSVAQAIFNPEQELLEKSRLTKEAALRYLCKSLKITRPQLKASLHRIQQTAMVVMYSPNNIANKTHRQSWIGEIITSGGTEMAEEKEKDLGCMGWYLPNEPQCNGNPDAEVDSEKNPCVDIEDCKIVTSVAAHEGVKPEVLFASRKEKGKGMTVKQIKAYAKKNNIEYAPLESVEQEPEAKTADEKQPVEETPAGTITETTDEKPAPSAKKGKQTKLNTECRALVDELSQRLGKTFGKEVKTKASADQEGDWYIMDKTDLAGGGSNYMALYSHRMKGRDQGIAVFILKPRTKTLDIGVACSGLDAVKAILDQIQIQHGLASKATPADGAFKARILGMGIDGLDIVVQVVKSLADTDQLKV